jgi:hypothetical protein
MQRHARLVQRVRNAVGQQRVDARPCRQDLHRTDSPGRGIAVARGEDVTTYLFGDPRKRAQTGHRNSVAVNFAMLLTQPNCLHIAARRALTRGAPKNQFWTSV